ncbi:MAG TPA: N-acetylmuramoyl-L-alanine amidase [Sulfurimonas sp.]|nr:N-acetylmuramoyl-L-alanine amidase [Sulfurimonas sp.]
MKVFLFLFLALKLYALVIIDKPITFDKERIYLAQKYISKHYGLEVKNINITPRLIVIHWTAENDFNKSFNHFKDSSLPLDRPYLAKASTLNVSSHFLISRQGKIYRLMPENIMARHVIGLNYNAIGIENVGGEKNLNNLTSAQLQANIDLISYLKAKYKSLKYLIGHHEYTQCQDLEFWLEKDKNYQTTKYDPGDTFMSKLRSEFPSFKSCLKAK